MSTRFCNICGRGPMATYSGLTKHVLQCEQKHSRPRQVYVAETPTDTSCSTVEDQSGFGLVISEQYDEPVSVDNANKLNGTPGTLQNSSKRPIEDEEEDIRLQTPANKAGHVKSTGVPTDVTQSWDETFEESEKNIAGFAIQVVPPIDPDIDTASGLYLGSFTSELDYAFAKRLQEGGISKRHVQRLFDDPRMGQLHAQLGFKNSHQWLKAISNLSTGIKDGIWTKEDIAVTSGLRLRHGYYTMIYQNVLTLAAFILAHRPFENEMTYAPRRTYTDAGRTNRIYHELHSGDWWWNVQKKLPPGATIVPIIVAVDKTQLSMHQGDVSAWPVYVTIGNLNRQGRRGRNTPGVILGGFVPELKGVDAKFKRQAYHYCMGKILQRELGTVNECQRQRLTQSPALEDIAETGVELPCADGKIRHCYPILCAILADYEEQALLTGVKGGRHCTRCIVPPDEREDLSTMWAWRTEEYTRRQQDRNLRKEHDDYVHPVSCFAWKHPHFNIHEGMPTDTLHLLLKGLVMSTMKWMQRMLDDLHPGQRKTQTVPVVPIEFQNGTAQLDERFRHVGYSTGLKRFNNRRPFSEVAQWTGSEQKDLVRQLVATIVPILVPKAPYAHHFMRAMCDLVTLAQYKSHDEGTLGYIEDAIHRLNVLKEEFRPYRIGKTHTKPHFNYPKWHAVVHIVSDIKNFGALDGMCTGANSEAHHIDMVKKMYNLTNKQNFIEQICQHNSRRLALLAAEHVVVAARSRPFKTIDQKDRIYATYTSNPQIYKYIRWFMPGQTPYSNTFMLAEVAKRIDIPDFTHAMAVFARESRKKYVGEQSSSWEEDRLEVDPSWVGTLKVKIHPSLHCWRTSGEYYNDPEHCEKDLVRCTPDWNGSGTWRKDFVWVQEFTRGDARRRSCAVADGRAVAKMHLIFTLVDTQYHDEHGRHPEFSGAFVETMQFENNGAVDKTTGLISVRSYPRDITTRRRTLQAFKVYDLPTVLRPAHLVKKHLNVNEPGDESAFFVNNYIDWDEYNRLYSPDFNAEWSRLLRKYKAKKRRTT